MDTLESRPVLDLTEQLASSVALAYRIHLNTSNLLATTMTQTGAIEIIRQLFKGYAGGNISHRERAEIGNSTTLESEPLALNEADAATFSNFIPGYVQWEAISKSGQETIIKRLRAYKKSIFRNQGLYTKALRELQVFNKIEVLGVEGRYAEQYSKMTEYLAIGAVLNALK